MKRLAGLLTILPIILLAACAPIEPPPPDPIREEITILQKQLLEVQKTSNENKLKLDEATNTINTLNAKIKELEEKQAVRYAPAQPTAKAAPAKKKPVKKQVKKKKKPGRRTQ